MHLHEQNHCKVIKFTRKILHRVIKCDNFTATACLINLHQRSYLTLHKYRSSMITGIPHFNTNPGLHLVFICFCVMRYEVPYFVVTML